MAKIVDITDKLNFDEKPKIKIKGEELEINDSATAMLKILPKLRNNPTLDDVNEMFEMLFSEKDRKKIEKLNLNFENFKIFIAESVRIVSGADEEDPEGESQTPATT